MGSLVAVGGFHLPGSAVRTLSRELDEICENYGFPTGEEFKWSPNKGSWMKTDLLGRDRHDFFAAYKGLKFPSATSLLPVP
jgi:hypothetical protein